MVAYNIPTGVPMACLLPTFFFVALNILKDVHYIYPNKAIAHSSHIPSKIHSKADLLSTWKSNALHSPNSEQHSTSIRRDFLADFMPLKSKSSNELPSRCKTHGRIVYRTSSFFFSQRPSFYNIIITHPSSMHSQTPNHSWLILLLNYQDKPRCVHY